MPRVTTDWSSDHIECPHCGYHLDTADVHQDEDTECPECEKPFHIQVEYTVEYRGVAETPDGV